MAANGSNSPAWLFSFVDLAFLLLIAMTQLAAEPGLDLGEMVVPRIRAGATEDLPAKMRERWQLRVHAGGEAGAPFELVLAGGDEPAAAAGTARLAREPLRARLRRLREMRDRKPLLAPHADARSQDLLDAVEVLEEQWPSRRRVTVARVFGER